MKKLMIAAVAVACAAAAQAATINWSSNQKIFDGTGGTGAAVGTAYIVSASDYARSALLVDLSKADSVAAFKTAFEATTHDVGSTTLASGKINAKASPDADGKFSAATETAYFVVIDTVNEQVFLSNELSANFVSVGEKYTFGWTSGTSGNAADVKNGSKNLFAAANGLATSNNGAAWYNVPEPTSGLLLLLGVAGLALRRRRA